MILDTFPAAPADTLLGRLQRGTGAGFLEALAAGKGVARAALEGAIRLDWRWDQQLDSRSWYYACLAEHLGISSADVEKLILATVDHDPRDSVDRVAVHVLGQLASWGDHSAAERLIDYVRYGGSPDIPVSWCAGEGTAADLDRLHAALGARFPNRAAVARDTANLPAWSLSYLEFYLESLARRDDRFMRFGRLLASAKASRTAKHDESPPRPAEASPAAVRTGPCSAAVELLERSERPDAELVRSCLRSALAANDMYPVCDMLDIVKRARLEDLVPDVERAYHDATYSFGARLRAVETLERLAPDLFRERYARECLWDCEECIIEIGCRHVELDDPDVRPRLEFLRDAFESDADEEPEGIHHLARDRLGY